MNRKKNLALIVPIVFFLLSFLTLGDYGVSWDEPIHFHRGQAYLHYFLTGETRFKTLGSRSSYYQNDSLPAEYFFDNDSGHPPLNGILASLFNFIFYQKLELFGDIEAYHLFNITVSTILVVIVVLFAYETYGYFAAIISGLVLASYPLFFSEGHFNIKDPSEAAFFGLTIWAFWKSLKTGSWKWLLVSIIGFSLALGTKFNILFLPFIIGPYLITCYYKIFTRGFKYLFLSLLRIPRFYLLTLLVSPLIVLVIFFGSWPFLWQDPVNNFIDVLSYYKNLGIGSSPGFLVAGGFNAYPIVWILTTTPPWVVFLTFLGIIFSLKSGLGKERVAILWLLWFLVPIGRVSLPDTVIYGGVRQIMEFIPAMSLLAGVGASQIVTWLRGCLVKFYPEPSKHLTIQLLQALIIIGFIPHLLVMIKLHPNQNVYFNSFIGGLPGAQKLSVPYWGNSFGNAYWQAIQWLNDNAEKNAKVALIQGTGLNIPKIKLRSDIAYSNYFWSGINREGEYLMELTHQDPVRLYPYAWEYVEKFLDPVYIVQVEGIPIAKVWKNDFTHTTAEFRLKETYVSSLYRVEGSKILMDLGEKEKITRLTISWSGFPKCDVPAGRFYTSIDAQNWQEESERWPLSYSQIPAKAPIPLNSFTFFLPGREARFVEFVADNSNSCALQNPKVELSVLK